MAPKSTPNNPRLKPPRETIQKNKCPQVLMFSGSKSGINASESNDSSNYLSEIHSSLVATRNTAKSAVRSSQNFAGLDLPRTRFDTLRSFLGVKCWTNPCRCRCRCRPRPQMSRFPPKHRKTNHEKLPSHSIIPHFRWIRLQYPVDKSS